MVAGLALRPQGGRLGIGHTRTNRANGLLPGPRLALEHSLDLLRTK
jgi:hypothetical protein